MIFIVIASVLATPLGGIDLYCKAMGIGKCVAETKKLVAISVNSLY